MRNHDNKEENKKLSLGAVAVETAMVIGVYLALIFLMLVFGLAAFRYTILVDATTATSRAISQNASTGIGNCAQLSNEFNTQARSYIANTYGYISSSDISFNVNVRQNGSPNDCRLTVISAWVFPALIPGILEIPPLQITQMHAIEDAIFRRCGGCSTCPS